MALWQESALVPYSSSDPSRSGVVEREPVRAGGVQPRTVDGNDHTEAVKGFKEFAPRGEQTL